VPTATVNGIELYYERAGLTDQPGAPRVLFISGSGSDLRVTRLFAGPLSETCDLVLYDQRCLGQSGWGDRPPTMADYGADAAGLLDHVGWDRCRVIGVSFGGMVAQEMAVTWPERVERLVLACTSPGGAGGASYPLHELWELPREEREVLNRTLMDTRGDDAGEAYRNLLQMMAAATGGQNIDPRQEHGMKLQLAARSHHDTFDRLGRLTMPVLIAAGRFDGIAPLANQEAMLARIPDARLAVYDGGHAFTLQDPSAWPEMAAFLTG
jgi:3-oxoadipate enol-lactonase